MENKDKLDEFLSQKMALEELNLPEPSLSLIAEARKKITARKKSTSEIEDTISLLAAFLNFKIKLYHAVIASIIVGGIILCFTKEDTTNKKEIPTSEYVSNIASVKSSTVLSSIYTFGLNKKQIYGRATQ